MKSFLSGSSLKGKTVIPFNTNDGYGVGSCFDTVKALCPQSTVLEGFFTTGGVGKDRIPPAIKGARAKEVEREVKTWLERLQLVQ
jgi:hypothetical protein